MRPLFVVILVLVVMGAGLVACAAGLVGIFGIASVEETMATVLPTMTVSEVLRPIAITDARILTGYGSPIPALVEVSGTWPDLCAQLAEVGRPALSAGRIEIALLAGPARPGCPPDRVGLPFRMQIPLNWMTLEEGAYCVSMNAAEPGNLEILLPGDWTYPASGIWYQQIALTVGEPRTGINFSWDYQLH